MHVRRLKPSDTDRYGRKVQFEQLPHAAIDELPLNATGLLLYLLRVGPSFSGRIRDLYRVRRLGMGKDALEVAAGKLMEAGYLSYIDQRDARGRLSRVLVVTTIPGEFPPVSSAAAVSQMSHALSRENAESLQVGPRPEYQASVRPAGTRVSAGGTESGQSGLGATSGNTAYPQVGPRPEYQASVPPAEMIDWSDIDAGQHGFASRARAGQTPTTTDTYQSSSAVDPATAGSRPRPREEDENDQPLRREFLAALDVLVRIPAPPKGKPLSYDEAAALVPLVDRCLREPAPWPPSELLAKLSRKLDDVDNLRALLEQRLTKQIPWIYPDPQLLLYPHELPQPAPVLADQAPWQTCDSCERAYRADRPGLCRDCRALLADAPDIGEAS